MRHITIIVLAAVVAIAIAVVLMVVDDADDDQNGIENEGQNDGKDVFAMTDNRITIKAGDAEMSATLCDNSSAKALLSLLKKGDLVVEMNDYGDMEKVGPIGSDLPTNDVRFTTEPGDLVLYQGSMLVIYYDDNTWNFTKLGHIDDLTQTKLKEILGDGDITVTLSIQED